jgi:hypothetical protein
LVPFRIIIDLLEENHVVTRTKVQFGTVLKSQGYEQVRGSTGRYWQGLTTFVVT